MPSMSANAGANLVLAETKMTMAPCGHYLLIERVVRRCSLVEVLMGPLGRRINPPGGGTEHDELTEGCDRIKHSMVITRREAPVRAPQYIDPSDNGHDWGSCFLNDQRGAVLTPMPKHQGWSKRGHGCMSTSRPVGVVLVLQSSPRNIIDS